MPYEFLVPKKMVMGENAIESVPAEINGFKKTNPLVVTDAGVAEAGILNRLLSALDAGRIRHTVFSGVEPDPEIAIIEKGNKVCREGNHDIIIALGGGSSIDAAKAISVLATNEGGAKDYVGIGAVYKNDPLLVIAIPTTAGTGSEVTSVAVLTDKANQVKLGMKGPQLVPAMAILDPTLLTSLPPRLIAATGLDAFTHALESFMSIRSNAFTQSFSLSAAKMVYHSLIPFKENPKNIDLASKMLYGSCLAGIAFGNGGVGAMHALAHAIGSHYHVAHGLACGLVMAAVLRENMDASLEKYGTFLEGLGYNTTGLSGQECAERLIAVLTEFIKKLELPTSLTPMGIRLEVPPEMVAAILKDPPMMANPKKYDEATVRRLLESIR
ncbi:MAG TPA: iron-containing alcohol dehydrogenase [Syntrophorhabdales bacterium]|nr:iron-containing alcohol dehydrogenase [Syntrophorhabdales bacterium]